MNTNTKIHRQPNVIKTDITPLSTELKVKIKSAVEEVVNKIKEKHL
jgi:hypothetical protein